MYIETNLGFEYSMDITFNCDIIGKRNDLFENRIKCISNKRYIKPCFGKITHHLRNDCIYTGSIILHFNTNKNEKREYCFFDIETINFYLNKIRKIVNFEYILKKSKKYSDYYDLQIKIKELNKCQLYFVLNMIRRLYNHPQAEFLHEAIKLNKEKKYNLFDLLLIGDRLDTATHPDNVLYSYSRMTKCIRINKNTLIKKQPFTLSSILTSKRKINKDIFEKMILFRNKNQGRYEINSKWYNLFLKDINNILQLVYKSIRKC